MSSVLYRRMATDPDAPITAADGRFWLRGRPLPDHTTTALRPAVRRVRRTAADRHSARGRHPAAASRARHVSALPEPHLIALPLDTLHVANTQASAGRRERAVASLAERLQRFVATHTPTSAQLETWEADRTFRKLVAPLLTLLGYRRADQQSAPSTRGRNSRRLEAGTEQTILLDVFRVGHALGDADARPTLTRAAAMGARWVLLANGREVRLYAPALSGALHEPAGALVLRVDLEHDDAEQTAHLLWLLTRGALADGALDAYLASRAVGTALLGALDDPASPIVAALTDAVQAATGLQLPVALVARHARLAVRGERGRDGEPMPQDIPAVAAIAGSSAVIEPEDSARIAS
jgi:hypothetical protein